MKYPTMWCVETPRQKLLLGTLSHSKEDALFKLFGFMSEAFQKKHWKNEKSSKKAYQEKGYIAIKVAIQPLPRQPRGGRCG